MIRMTSPKTAIRFLLTLSGWSQPDFWISSLPSQSIPPFFYSFGVLRIDNCVQQITREINQRETCRNEQNAALDNGKSLCLMASIIRRPTPGMENTTSVSIAPPKKRSRLKVPPVITGIKAFLNTCFMMTTLSFCPFALAVLTKSWRITSSMLERVILATTAVLCIPSARAGIINCLKLPKPEGGSHPRLTENRIIIRMPIQKMGADVPMSASTIAALSEGSSADPETIPRKVPRMTAMMIAAVAGLNCVGKHCHNLVHGTHLQRGVPGGQVVLRAASGFGVFLASSAF